MAAQNKEQANKLNKVQQLTKADSFPNEKTDTVTPVSNELKENSNKRVALNSDSDDLLYKNNKQQQQSDDDFAEANKMPFDLQLNEVEVVVESSSSPSSSPSSPTSSTSSSNSLHLDDNDHVSNKEQHQQQQQQQPTTPSQTQISA